MKISAAEARLMVEPSNVTPAWLLPYWRLLRTRAQGDYALAWRLLPDHISPPSNMPSIVEAAITLADHRLI
jgi:hypothetical protein